MLNFFWQETQFLCKTSAVYENKYCFYYYKICENS